tara:strand:+ start:124 stop:642 length:519 start_codon:yes stop_codon:yes gene_type:complete
MQNNLFSIPFFIDKVDLNKINIKDYSLEPTFRAGLLTSYNTQKEVKSDTLIYLTEIIQKSIKNLPTNYKNIKIIEIWRNVYKETDFQDPHIHINSQWSFIIYENVDVSRTVFLNPYRHLAESQMYMYDSIFYPDMRPELHSGDIIIFPSFVEHYVLTGGKGSTISGNVSVTI